MKLSRRPVTNFEKKRRNSKMLVIPCFVIVGITLITGLTGWKLNPSQSSLKNFRNAKTIDRFKGKILEKIGEKDQRELGVYEIFSVQKDNGEIIEAIENQPGTFEAGDGKNYHVTETKNNEGRTINILRNNQGNTVAGFVEDAYGIY